MPRLKSRPPKKMPQVSLDFAPRGKLGAGGTGEELGYRSRIGRHNKCEENPRVFPTQTVGTHKARKTRATRSIGTSEELGYISGRQRECCAHRLKACATGAIFKILFVYALISAIWD